MAEISYRKGIYKIRVYIGKDVNGKKITESTTFTPTKTTPKAIEKEVQEFASNYEKQVKEGKILSGEKITLADIVEEWKQDQTFKDLTKSVQESYIDILERRIFPHIGHLKIAKIVYGVPKRNADRPARGNYAAAGGNINRRKWEFMMRRQAVDRGWPRWYHESAFTHVQDRATLESDLSGI